MECFSDLKDGANIFFFANDGGNIEVVYVSIIKSRRIRDLKRDDLKKIIFVNGFVVLFPRSLGRYIF